MQLKKLAFLSIFILIFALSSLYSADGILWGEKNLCVIKTQWFDIIFPEGSKKSAELLAQNADSIYYEIAELYGRAPQARMPVVLSPNRESANAYFSVQFYNHIVLYDTAASKDLALFSNDLLSSFRHELTHAFTYNMKGDFWSGVDKVFGDAVNPAGLFITLGWAEGATLTSESANGEGRLNDEYSKHIVKQAKIENQFPAYSDVQGASDKYPIGSYYNFNGAFNEWLQKKYGMEKYAQFWYKCVNFKTLTTHGAFKKIYGIKIEQAWALFKNDMEVPQTPPSPLDFENLEITDFFGGGKNYSAKNNGGAVFTNLTACQNKIAWLEEKSESVFIFQKNQAKKLFSVQGAKKISLSRDGRYLAISYISQQKPNFACRIKIYDLQKKAWIDLKNSEMHDAAIIQSDNESYIVCQSFYSQSKKILIKKIEDSDWQIEMPLDANVSASDFVDIGGGQFAFVKQSGINRTLCFANVQGGIFFEQNLPQERMVVQNLFYDFDGNKIYFSYTVPQSMPRLGIFDINEKNFLLDKNDFSGGVFYPIKLNENEFLYIGKFYRQNRLLKMSAAGVFAQSGGLGAQPPGKGVAENEVWSEGDFSPNEIQKYKTLKYLKKGLFLPLGVVPSYSFDPRDENFGNSQYLFLGATYATNNPWNSNIYTISTGYSPLTNSGGIMLSANGGSDTFLLRWSANVQSEFDFEGWKQSFAGGTASSFFPFGKNSKIVLSEIAKAFVGRGNEKGISFFPTSTDQRKVFYAKNSASLYYSSIHQSGAGTYEESGISVGTRFLYEAAFDLESPQKYSDSAANISPFINFAIPKLIPIECRNFFVYNLPTSLSFAAFDKMNRFATASASCVLFGMDVQKAVPALTAIFINRFSFSTGYSISILRKSSSFGIVKTAELLQDTVDGKLSHTDYIHSTAVIEMTPNFGILANPIFRTGLEFQARYYFNRPENYKSDLNFFFNLNMNFSF